MKAETERKLEEALRALSDDNVRFVIVLGENANPKQLALHYRHNVVHEYAKLMLQGGINMVGADMEPATVH